MTRDYGETVNGRDLHDQLPHHPMARNRGIRMMTRCGGNRARRRPDAVCHNFASTLRQHDAIGPE